MIGILIVTHGELGVAFIKTLHTIYNDKIENLTSVAIDTIELPESLRDKIKKGVKKVKSDNGVIIFTDMFGGTPSDLSYSFLEEGVVEVISGVNIPMLIKALDIREKMTIKEASEHIIAYGKKYISIGSNIIKGADKLD